jgi:hypothetical protein
LDGHTNRSLVLDQVNAQAAGHENAFDGLQGNAVDEIAEVLPVHRNLWTVGNITVFSLPLYQYLCHSYTYMYISKNPNPFVRKRSEINLEIVSEDEDAQGERLSLLQWVLAPLFGAPAIVDQRIEHKVPVWLRKTGWRRE